MSALAWGWAPVVLAAAPIIRWYGRRGGWWDSHSFAGELRDRWRS